ncbi:hypothetical protein, conserved [Plasmodium gonderi]|uniref:Uncharacterized protein n=1 Tax=Plasmodium gonderi TaxID=77519 RepID=A0A1Y1JK56_PLAGO|nr:hypothetical protein, conserved [Plasmodium gonderi]GAW82841.1 hypothetical protein, conserved [Plasmodium gonderi]
MITSGGERTVDERRSCFKYFLTLMFLFVLMLILRKQKEEEEELNSRTKMNLRQNENYRNFAFNYLREISFLRYDSAVYISPNRKIIPSIKYFNNKNTIYVEGYDNILHNFENLSVGINEVKGNFYIYAEQNNKQKSGIYVNKKDINDSYGIINTILVDTTLFRNMQISSCNEKDVSLCFFVFVELKKNKCYNFNNLSYSCHMNNSVKNYDLFLMNNYCYVILASSKIESAYEFINKKLIGKDPFYENITMQHVEIITHFCGNVINQIATIDAVNGRLLFVQRYIQSSDKRDQNGQSGRTDNGNQSVIGSHNQSASGSHNQPANDENNPSSGRRSEERKQNKAQFNTEKYENEEYQKYAKFYPFNNYIKNENNSNSHKFQISYCLSVINLLSENRDIIEYVEYMTNKPEFSVFPPIHIAFDEQSNFYYIVQHEINGFLNFIFISPSKLFVYYTLKIREFYSGWLLNSSQDYDSKGLVLFGEYPPYEDELHVWDIRNLQHRKYLVNIIKTY